MEDGVKEPKFPGLAGWVKKAPGRLLASYKDRYILVEKTEIAVYENEDLQKCLERIDLENYDRCHELKSPFKKRHRLILIRSTKSGNKVTDVKFQAQTAEEKEAWIKTFTEAINRAKNKAFDEVKVDEGSNLEHVTRSRPKGNRNRRPPTRIHMKEVAVMSSDGILRLDLDLEDAVMPYGAPRATADGTETPKGSKTIAMPLLNLTDAEDKQSGSSAGEIKLEDSPKKNIIKPPMPPTKETKSSSEPEDELDKDGASEKKVLKPPMPPSKEAKSFIVPVEEVTEEDSTEKMSEKSPDARKKTGAPPTPSNKPSSSSSISSLTEPVQSRLNPPKPPSKEKKPSPSAPEQQVQGKADENNEKDDDNRKETRAAVETDEDSSSMENINGTASSSTEEQVSEEASRDNVSSHCRLVTNKKKLEEPAQSDTQHSEEKPNERENHTASLQTGPDTFDSSLQAEECLHKYPVRSIVSSNEPPADSLNLSPLLCHLPGEKKRKAEEKSVDSGQHSDDDSEGSGSEDTLAASTAALSGSHARLDVSDASEDRIQKSEQHSNNIQDITKQQVKSKVFTLPHSKPIIPLKPSTKVRSASIGDLLTDSSVCLQVRQHTRAVAQSYSSPTDDVMKLETVVALEMEKTDELLNRMSQFQDKGDSEGKPENLLAEAMEKLRKADHVLREVRKLNLAKNSMYRKSW